MIQPTKRPDSRLTMRRESFGPPLKTQRSGFEWERRSKEMKCSFRCQAEMERNGFRSDEEVMFYQ